MRKVKSVQAANRGDGEGFMRRCSSRASVVGDSPGSPPSPFAPCSFQKSPVGLALRAGKVRCNPGPFASPSFI